MSGDCAAVGGRGSNLHLYVDLFIILSLHLIVHLELQKSCCLYSLGLFSHGRLHSERLLYETVVRVQLFHLVEVIF